MTIVDEILDLARIESGRLELNDEDFDLRALLTQVGRLHQPRAAEKQTAVQMTVDPTVPRLVRGDESRLRQVVSNLVSNAIKFTEHGTVTVGVTSTPSSEGRLGLRFTVSDTGIGMSESELPTLFDPFVQANAGISGTFGGSGLGLTICRELVELMGGEIEVTSRPGEGTTFTFTLMLTRARTAIDDSSITPSPEIAIDPPIDIDDVVPPPRQAASHLHDAAASDAPAALTGDDHDRAAGPHGRLLIVEDNTVNQEITYETLRWLGFEADVVGDGAAALAALDAGQSYDAILMDCRMPVMDGYEATRRIRRRSDAVARIPIIAMTALIDNSGRQECLDVGMSDFVMKPASPAVLASVLTMHGLTVDTAAVAALDKQAATSS
ncbi:hypothetical protein BH23ACT10_BH23ACT10_08890 [soil metagenome]